MGNKKDKTAAEFGAEGGKARARTLSADERREIAQKAALARWEDHRPKDGMLRANHTGHITIGTVTLPCAVLEDGTRVLTQKGVFQAIGRTGQSPGQFGGRTDPSGLSLPVFLRAKNLAPFIAKDLIETSAPIKFRPMNAKGWSGSAYGLGFKAEILPMICQVFLEALLAGVLSNKQVHIAEQCRVLAKSFAVVGITALIDEATGYQDLRDRLALQKILDRYLRKELATWAKRFPDEFYQQMFRLKDWEWRGMGLKRPRIVGQFTADVVYQRLQASLLEELQRLNPKDQHGHRPAKHHQWLTEDVGHPALAQHLYAVIGLMRIADTWDEFYRLLQRAYPKRNTTQFLPFPDEAVTAS